MTKETSHPTLKHSVRVLVVAALVVPLFAMSSATAADGCGEISYAFPGTRLMNDGISTSAGPFPADIPAGTYTVTLIGHDHHLEQTDLASQDGEQFRVVLDSGYTSALSNDIPDDANTSTTVLTGQQIDSSTTISVEHGGAPGINSVDVVCVGFTLEDPPTEDITDPTEPIKEVAEPIEDVTEPTDLVEPVEPVVEEPPVQDIGEPVTLIREPEPNETPEAPVTEVESVQVANDQSITDDAPVLAITGPSGITVMLVGLAVTLIAAGAVLLQRERHLPVER